MLHVIPKLEEKDFIDPLNNHSDEQKAQDNKPTILSPNGLLFRSLDFRGFGFGSLRCWIYEKAAVPKCLPRIVEPAMPVMASPRNSGSRT